MSDAPGLSADQREAIARDFHEAYERLAPDFGYETRRESAVAWEDVPEANRNLMMAVVGEVVDGWLGEARRDEREQMRKEGYRHPSEFIDPRPLSEAALGPMRDLYASAYPESDAAKAWRAGVVRRSLYEWTCYLWLRIWNPRARIVRRKK